MEINEKYYKGYEGDPNMLFCRTENDIPVEKINIWYRKKQPAALTGSGCFFGVGTMGWSRCSYTEGSPWSVPLL